MTTQNGAESKGPDNTVHPELNATAEFKTLSKEDWAYVEDRVGGGLFGRAELLIDGYRVTLQREFISKNRLGIMTYVGGRFKGSWAVDKTEESTRFFYHRFIPIWRGKHAATMMKLVGKRKFAETYAKQGFVSRSPLWPSVKVARAALTKNNRNLELLRPGHPVLVAEDAKA